jgi:hypothetical protein
MFIGTNEPIKELVNRELHMFKRYWVDAKDIKCPLKWCGKHEFCFQVLLQLLLIKFLALWGPR